MPETARRVVLMRPDELQPYERNPRRNEAAVSAVAESIRRFGFKAPIVADRDHVIIAGHTRWKAAKRLRLAQVPVVIADDLTEEQARAYRIADNSAGERSEWDLDLLGEEIAAMPDLDWGLLGFGNGDEVDFSDLDSRMGEKDEAQKAFEDKFKPKHTTDDCFTPPEVYEAVLGWAVDTYGLQGRPVVRPFYPGGDYQSCDYPDGCVVIDNPPFSILSEIIRWYKGRGIDFFLFAPSLTSMHYLEECNLILTGYHVTYENGAEVPTAFVTDLGTDRILLSSELYDLLDAAQPRKLVADVSAYDWPANCESAARLAGLPKYGVTLAFKHIAPVKAVGEPRQSIFGGGVLICDRDAERIKAERIKAERGRTSIMLTADERRIIARLNAEDAAERDRWHPSSSHPTRRPAARSSGPWPASATFASGRARSAPGRPSSRWPRSRSTRSGRWSRTSFCPDAPSGRPRGTSSSATTGSWPCSQAPGTGTWGSRVR